MISQPFAVATDVAPSVPVARTVDDEFTLFVKKLLKRRIEIDAWNRRRDSPERARWVRAERWHRAQQGELLPDGGYRLTVPYADERELLMDILRHGAQVVVEAPSSLKKRVAEEAAKVAACYPRRRPRPISSASRESRAAAARLRPEPPAARAARPSSAG